MTRCAARSGVLFDHPCANSASAGCVFCGMPVCNAHARPTANGIACIACLRRTLRDPRQRPSFAHLRDDPYFYWYFDGGDWAEEYDRYDYALFDAAEGADQSPDLAMMPDEPWEGS